MQSYSPPPPPPDTIACTLQPPLQRHCIYTYIHLRNVCAGLPCWRRVQCSACVTASVGEALLRAFMRFNLDISYLADAAVLVTGSDSPCPMIMLLPRECAVLVCKECSCAGM